MSERIYSRIAGTGSYLPEKVLTNDDLSRFVDTSDEWIRSRTGIRERHVAADGQTEDDLEAPAPVVAVGDVVADGGHGHGDDHDEAEATDAASPGHSDAVATTDADPVARWLSGGALVAALAALGVALFGRRRSS